MSILIRDKEAVGMPHITVLFNSIKGIFSIDINEIHMVSAKNFTKFRCIKTSTLKGGKGG
jgi:hypothetical protein